GEPHGCKITVFQQVKIYHAGHRIAQMGHPFRPPRLLYPPPGFFVRMAKPTDPNSLRKPRMSRRCLRFLLPFVAATLLFTAAAFSRESATGPLAEYVAAKDDSYAWTKRSEGSVLT